MDLRRLQLTELEMLDVFSTICAKYNIKYSLHGGTLLGAVRHKGFIPWDDDLDVFMLRNEYNRFLKAWRKERPEGYFLQNKETEWGFTRSFSKIRKDNTTFLQDGDDPTKIHTGIFIDVFPVDRVPKNIFKKTIYYWHCLKYELLSREFLPPKSNIITKAAAAAVLKITPPKARKSERKRLLRYITKYNDDNSLPLAVIETVETMRNLLDHDLFDEYTQIEFEGKDYMCVKKWDHLLKHWYGDYMKLPPKSKRKPPHVPLIVDFEHNYVEHMKQMSNDPKK